MTHVEELKSSGLKATLPRIKILEIFQRSTRRHMTAEDVYKALLLEDADIGLATVYRVFRPPRAGALRSRRRKTLRRGRSSDTPGGRGAGLR